METLIRPINVNKVEDRAFAQTIQDRPLAALQDIDPATASTPGYDRKVQEQKLGVLNGIELGNTTAAHRCRACLVEIAFMDAPAVGHIFRLPPPVTRPAADVDRDLASPDQASRILRATGSWP